MVIIACVLYVAMPWNFLVRNFLITLGSVYFAFMTRTFGNNHTIQHTEERCNTTSSIINCTTSACDPNAYQFSADLPLTCHQNGTIVKFHFLYVIPDNMLEMQYSSFSRCPEKQAVDMY